jgi:AP endonuclease 2
VVLEFPAFVLLGVYCPARRNDARDDFRLGFLNALDARVRNLSAAGKRIFLTGDLNISRDEIDTANAEEHLRKHGMTVQEYLLMPARRLFNQLLLDGKVIGDRDEGREEPVLIDLCRTFHPNRKGMFTCWETKINARPGNFGSRIDYVLCSLDMKDWFCEADIQEGLLGSDHCPVYAVIKDTININHASVDIKDIMNPNGMFKEGVRLREWTMKDLLPISAKLIPEFDRRRNIRDMFAKKPSVKSKDPSEPDTLDKADAESLPNQSTTPIDAKTRSSPPPDSNSDIQSKASKRPADSSTPRSLKRNKSNGIKGQSSLMGFFRPKAALSSGSIAASAEETLSPTVMDTDSSNVSSTLDTTASQAGHSTLPRSPSKPPLAEDQDVIDPIVAKETWSKLLSKRVVPRCEHNDPCISYVTKKPGVNCGRSFYMCARPLGPSGVKERGTQWRCNTFIWSSDWTGDNS